MKHRALIAAVALSSLAVLSAPSAEAVSPPWIHLLSTSSRNLSYWTTSGTLSYLKPGQSNYGTKVYASCSGTTIFTVNGGSTINTQAKCSTKTLVAGNSYAYKTG